MRYPILKPFNPEWQPLLLANRLRPIYDTKAITQNVTRYNLFTPTPDQDETMNNYSTNPLPGNSKTLILAARLDFSLAVIRKAAGIDPVAIVNALRNGVVKITADQSKKLMFQARFSDLIDFNKATYSVAASQDIADDAQTVTESIQLPSGIYMQFPEAFFFGAGQIFQVEVNFPDASAFPTEAQWTTAGYGDLKMTLSLEVSDQA